MEQSNIDLIEGLLKKKKLSVDETEQLRMAWSKLASDTGYNDQSEEYLYKGIPKCGAAPFLDFLSSTENGYEILEKFFAGKRFQQDRENGFRLTASLLACLINSEDNSSLMELTIKKFPNTYWKKPKKNSNPQNREPLEQAKEIAAKFLFDKVDAECSFPDLGNMNLRRAYLNNFADSIVFLAQKKETGESVPETGESVNRILGWVAPYVTAKSGKTPEEPSAEPMNATDKEPFQKSNVPDLGMHPLQSTEVTVPEEKAASAPVAMSSVTIAREVSMELFSNLENWLSNMALEGRRHINGIRSRLEEQNNAFYQAQRDVLHLHQQLDMLNETVADLRERLKFSEDASTLLESRLKEKEAEILDKDEEIQRQKALADMQLKDNHKKYEESLQRIAAKIRVEYQDFMDAADMPMSCDLGENLRVQMSNIFKILEKGGMKFD